ncbi:MAG: hypothetical protein QM538_07195 [Methylacidiphilales bacterium]|nr:hypothetical protein [Candidatus Methylacidiphilales bacterium]
MYKSLLVLVCSLMSLVAVAEDEESRGLLVGVRSIEYVPRNTFNGIYLGMSFSNTADVSYINKAVENYADSVVSFSTKDLKVTNDKIINRSRWGSQSFEVGYLKPVGADRFIGGGGLEIGRRTILKSSHRVVVSSVAIVGQFGYRDERGLGVLVSVSLGKANSSKTNGSLFFTELGIGPVVPLKEYGEFVFRAVTPVQCEVRDFSCSSLNRLKFDFIFYID